MKKELKERVENALNELEAIKKELNKPTELENGKVYRHLSGCLVYKTGSDTGFGFRHNGKWGNYVKWSFDCEPNEWTEASDEEWLEALSKEADRRGFKDGSYECLVESSRTFKGSITSYALLAKERLHARINNAGYNVIMKDGVWAEVVKPEIRISICKHPEQNLILISDGADQLELTPDEQEYLRKWLNENK